MYTVAYEEYNDIDILSANKDGHFAYLDNKISCISMNDIVLAIDEKVRFKGFCKDDLQCKENIPGKECDLEELLNDCGCSVNAMCLESNFRDDNYYMCDCHMNYPDGEPFVIVVGKTQVLDSIYPIKLFQE